MEFVVIDHCPAPASMGPVLRAIRTAVVGGGTLYNSIYRGEDAAALLHANDKRTQAELFAELGPGVANPPRQSTHELYNDGVAYRGWRGQKLRAHWKVGLDVNDSLVRATMAEAAKHNWILTQTYPGSAVEFHHLNFRKPPVYFHTLKRGSRGPRVWWVQRKLKVLGDAPHRPMKRGRFDANTEANLKILQGHWKLKQDGIYGPHTSTTLHRALRKHARDKKEHR
jgi:hypothetical protein